MENAVKLAPAKPSISIAKVKASEVIAAVIGSS
jgi:hypothetical protein